MGEKFQEAVVLSSANFEPDPELSKACRRVVRDVLERHRSERSTAERAQSARDRVARPAGPTR